MFHIYLIDRILIDFVFMVFGCLLWSGIVIGKYFGTPFGIAITYFAIVV